MDHIEGKNCTKQNNSPVFLNILGSQFERYSLNNNGIQVRVNNGEQGMSLSMDNSMLTSSAELLQQEPSQLFFQPQ